MVNAISSALTGLNSATQKVNNAADNIANIGTEGADDSGLAQDIVDLKVAEIAFKANVATLETAQELSDELGRIFDEEI